MWSSHHPWLIPEPFTQKAGAMYGKEALDTWIGVLAQISDEAYSNPEPVRTAPHNGAICRLKEHLDDPSPWAMTWRACKRKRQARQQSPRVSLIRQGISRWRRFSR